MTQIANLGEFGLIRHLAEGLKAQCPETLVGIGDDCAVLRYSDDVDVLLTTDMLMEGVHFDLTYMPLRHLGYKSAMVNLSDIYAMGGQPRQLTVSLAISKRFSVEDIDEFYAGLRLACDAHGVDIVGGDTTTSLTGLAISITAIGHIPHGQAIRRNGAKETDLICVSGDLGAAYMGLQLLEREKRVYYSQWEKAQALQGKANEEALRQLETAQPDFAGREYLLERQMRPEARRDILQALQNNGIHPTAMMDISDGLSSELMHICTQSHVGCRIYEEHLPIDYQTAVAAEEFNLNVTTCALNGGEDYELLFTIPIADHERVAQIKGIHLIGHITNESLGQCLITRDGQEFTLKAQGWNPLREDTEKAP